MGLLFLYFAMVSFPVLIGSTWSDLKTLLIDVRPLYFLIGLAFGGFFANGVSIWFAIAVSGVLLVMQYLSGKAKLAPLGRADFALLQVFGLAVMLFSPDAFRLVSFFVFMVALLCFLGVYRLLAKHRAFAPVVLFSFFLFCLAKAFVF